MSYFILPQVWIFLSINFHLSQIFRILTNANLKNYYLYSTNEFKFVFGNVKYIFLINLDSKLML